MNTFFELQRNIIIYDDINDPKCQRQMELLYGYVALGLHEQKVVRYTTIH